MKLNTVVLSCIFALFLTIPANAQNFGPTNLTAGKIVDAIAYNSAKGDTGSKRLEGVHAQGNANDFIIHNDFSDPGIFTLRVEFPTPVDLKKVKKYSGKGYLTIHTDFSGKPLSFHTWWGNAYALPCSEENIRVECKIDYEKSKGIYYYSIYLNGEGLLRIALI